MTLLNVINVISHPSSSHTDPNYWPESAMQQNLIRRVFSVNNFLHPANTLRSQKEEIRRIFDKNKTLFLGAKRTPPEGWFHEPRSEAESALRKRNHAPAGCTQNNRTLTPAHTCDRVKIVRAESAPRKTNRAMRMHLRCIRTIHAPEGCMYPHPKGAV